MFILLLCSGIILLFLFSLYNGFLYRSPDIDVTLLLLFFDCFCDYYMYQCCAFRMRIEKLCIALSADVWPYDII